jgi:hypothetical protein
MDMHVLFYHLRVFKELMNSILRRIGVLLFLMLSSCENIDEIEHGCTVRVSENVYNSKFSAEDITSIRIINGVTQQTLYPVPDWAKSKDALEVTDPEFFKKFRNCIIAAGWKKEPPPVVHIRGNLQIQVSFKEGPGAYLFCRPSNHDLGVVPMFSRDSYGNANEPLFELINNALGSPASGPVPNN